MSRFFYQDLICYPFSWIFASAIWNVDLSQIRLNYFDLFHFIKVLLKRSFRKNSFNKIYSSKIQFPKRPFRKNLQI